MNASTAVGPAKGNDPRGIGEGQHAYAARTGHYSPLTRGSKEENGDLEEFIEIPAAVGIVGGITSVHPAARISLKILGVKNAKEMGEVMAAVGLIQNFGAVKGLGAERIQTGHNTLQA